MILSNSFNYVFTCATITASYPNRIKYTGEENAFNYRLFNPRNSH